MKLGSPLGPIPDEIMREVGRLCAGWSYFEFVTEQTIWGILEIDHNLGRLITWPKDLRALWQTLLLEAPLKHSKDEVKVLRNINAKITEVTKDRNIIIHGLISAAVAKTAGCIVTSEEITVVPAWTVFKGEHAGKRFEISLQAVEIVNENIQKLSAELLAFNHAHNYRGHYFPDQLVETNWPKPL